MSALQNLNNYQNYVPLINTGYMVVDVRGINDSNLDEHFMNILNIFKDGIETQQVQGMMLHVIFADNEEVDLTIFDYFYNLIFWKLATIVNEPITSKHLFFPEDITKKEIKWYIDHIFVKSYKLKIDFKTLNNAIDDTIYKFKFINDFAMYFANTVNFEDSIDLMKIYPEFYESIHADLSNVPLEEVKNVGMQYANTQIRYIKNSNHCLADSFRAQESINPKQYKEVAVNIGSKPDGLGGVFPTIIGNSFINGGVNTPESYLIDSSVGRTAQILAKMNVGISGAFARLLEINNIDTILHPDPNYVCDTRNYETVLIKDSRWLNAYNMRYYKTNPKGIDYVLDAETDKHLIGQTLLFRSPMTCSSFAKGHGICRRCYGDLYFINKDINIGKIAAELLSSIYTQILLSAKHLLESLVVKMEWTPGFLDTFEVTLNTIGVFEDINYDGYKLIIDPLAIQAEDDNDEIEYNEYITSFDVECPDGSIVNHHAAELESLYISEELNELLRESKHVVDGKFYIPMEKLKSVSIIFLVQIQNKELSRTLERAKGIINNAKITKMYDRNTILEAFMDANLEGGINLNAVHMELLLANQIRSEDDILEKPDWTIPGSPYNILTLSSSLTNNPSITITLEYQKIAQTFVNPLTSRKKKASAMDVYFMTQPQEFIKANKAIISDEYKYKSDAEINIVDVIEFRDKTAEDNDYCLPED